jgi:hypothetical protein
MSHGAEPIKPNFFIIGAPKCGTTALSEYLSLHADVHFSKPKEPLFFHTDFAVGHRQALDWNEYMKCFDRREMERCSMVGEGTVWYLYSRAAVANILEFNPFAKFIVMVRDPVDLAHSLHSQLLYGGHEDVEDFERAWRLQARRAKGECIPLGCPDPKALQYGAIAKLGEQLERLYALVPRDRVRVMQLAQLRSDPAKAYQQTLRFLGVAPDARRAFPVRNANRRIRLKKTAKLLHVGMAAKQRFGVRRSWGIWRALSPVITVEERRRPMADSLREELRAYFSDDVRRLDALLARQAGS